MGSWPARREIAEAHSGCDGFGQDGAFLRQPGQRRLVLAGEMRENRIFREINIEQYYKTPVGYPGRLAAVVDQMVRHYTANRPGPSRAALNRCRARALQSEPREKEPT
jgi:hypothetical protein